MGVYSKQTSAEFAPRCGSNKITVFTCGGPGSLQLRSLSSRRTEGVSRGAGRKPLALPSAVPCPEVSP